MIRILANPHAGNAQKAIAQITTLCKSSGQSYSLTLSERPGEAGRLAAALPLTDRDKLVIVGGDGFLNETTGAFVHEKTCPCPIVLYPAGTGNDFARGVRMDRSLAALGSIISDNISHSVRKHDVFAAEWDMGSDAPAQALPTAFNVSCGFGMDAAVCRELDSSRVKRLFNRVGLGKLSYVIMGIREVLRTSPEKRTSLRLILDRDTDIHLNNLAFIAFHNLPYEGGGFPFAPEAVPDDGKLNICAVTVPSRLCLFPLLLASLLGGRHPLFRPWVHMYTCSEAEFFSDRPLPLHTDGEVGGDPVHARIRLSSAYLPLLYAVRGD